MKHFLFPTPVEKGYVDGTRKDNTFTECLFVFERLRGKRLWVPPKLPVTITSVPLQTEMVISTFYPRTCAAGSRRQSGQPPSRIAVAAGKEGRKVNLWRPDQLALVAEIAIFGTLSET